MARTCSFSVMSARNHAASAAPRVYGLPLYGVQSSFVAANQRHRAPASASASAIDFPNPRLAPVITATRPLRVCSDISSDCMTTYLPAPPLLT